MDKGSKGLGRDVRDKVYLVSYITTGAKRTPIEPGADVQSVWPLKMIGVKIRIKPTQPLLQNEYAIAGISDKHCAICFGVAMWNGNDPILKERLFGLAGPEGNHGEDVKELYYSIASIVKLCMDHPDITFQN